MPCAAWLLWFCRATSRVWPLPSSPPSSLMVALPASFVATIFCPSSPPMGSPSPLYFYPYQLRQDLRNNPFAQRPPQNNPSFPIHNNGPAFPRPGPPFSIARREYDAEPDMSDHCNSMNSSTTRLAGAPAVYEQSSGESLSPPCRSFTILLSGDTGSVGMTPQPTPMPVFQ
jgi:hypothetical protein